MNICLKVSCIFRSRICNDLHHVDASPASNITSPKHWAIDALGFATTTGPKTTAAAFEQTRSAREMYRHQNPMTTHVVGERRNGKWEVHRERREIVLCVSASVAERKAITSKWKISTKTNHATRLHHQTRLQTGNHRRQRAARRQQNEKSQGSRAPQAARTTATRTSDESEMEEAARRTP